MSGCVARGSVVVVQDWSNWRPWGNVDLYGEGEYSLSA